MAGGILPTSDSFLASFFLMHKTLASRKKRAKKGPKKKKTGMFVVLLVHPISFSFDAVYFTVNSKFFLLLFALFERACAIVALQHYSILTLEYQEEKRRC